MFCLGLKPRSRHRFSVALRLMEGPGVTFGSSAGCQSWNKCFSGIFGGTHTLSCSHRTGRRGHGGSTRETAVTRSRDGENGHSCKGHLLHPSNARKQLGHHLVLLMLTALSSEPSPTMRAGEAGLGVLASSPWKVVSGERATHATSFLLGHLPLSTG